MRLFSKWLNNFLISAIILYTNLLLANDLPHIAADLIAEDSAIETNEPFWLGVRLQHEKHWHTYWKNPGDSGLPTQIKWTLPDGFKASPIHWPAPERIELPPLVNYGYSGDILLLTEIIPSDKLTNAQSISIQAEISLLVCKEVCIPGQATFSIELPIKNQKQPNEKWRSLFTKTKKLLPVTSSTHKTSFAIHGQEVIFLIDNKENQLNIHEYIPFAAAKEFIDHASEPSIQQNNNTIKISYLKNAFFQQPTETVELVLANQRNKQSSLSLIAKKVDYSAILAVENDLGKQSVKASSSALEGLGISLLFAFIGGLILNLMPCVFPVLSLKILSLTKIAKQSNTESKLQGIFYTTGIIISFLVLAVILIILKETGNNLGWGFQLQTPWFVGLMIYILFLLGLMLSGAINIAGSFMGIGQSLTNKGGKRNAFFTGMLAVLVASPCTAPFMGPAMGYALTHSTLEALLVFISLGLGLASPFLLISFVPTLASLLPKPGMWMEKFKQIMAFPMYLTIIWLIWVLGRQTSIDTIVILLFGMILLIFGIWLIKSINTKSFLAKSILYPAIFLCLLLPIGMLSTAFFEASANKQGKAQNGWVAYNPSTLETLISNQKTIFVNMTADWCLTCLANEKLVLSTDAVKALFQENDVVYMKGDWTNQDPEITKFLNKYNRQGVPLYVVYKANQQPEVLPQLLTKSIITESIVITK